ncbi:DUF4440 domain-containing protein [Phytomonospora sp. NPDC050363]|uniref:YybH family protein n=1 Tax=Phytomonospora sp. NPDC050363 TaxID=3155642 RepID=UPI0033D729EF
MSMPLARRAADVPAVFAARFNHGDPAAVAEVYEQTAVLVGADGAPATGEGLAAVLAGHLALGEPIAVTPRKVFEAGDLALLIVDWVIGDEKVRGTATDVARRGADGNWRYVIDNPFGAA